MRTLAAALVIALAPIACAPFALPALAATISELGDLSALSTIATDTLAVTKTGDLAAAQKRITDFETAWDNAAGTMQPMSPSKWQVIDAAADKAIGSLRASSPNEADAETALTALIAALDNPGGGAAAATPAAATPATTFTVTNADGSPLPCEVALKTLRDAAATRTASDKAKFDETMNTGIDRCNADDDKRADGIFADAYALLQ